MAEKEFGRCGEIECGARLKIKAKEDEKKWRGAHDEGKESCWLPEERKEE